MITQFIAYILSLVKALFRLDSATGYTMCTSIFEVSVSKSGVKTTPELGSGITWQKVSVLPRKL